MVIVAESLFSAECPFETPLSMLIYSIIDAVKLWREGHSRQITPNLVGLAEGALVVSTAALHGLHQRVQRSSLPHSLEKRHGFDARCIARILVLSTDVDTIRLTMDFAQEVIWDAGTASVPLGWFYRKLISCFDFTHPHTPILIPTLRDIAFFSAKAFTHIQIQQHYISQHRRSGHVDENWRKDIRHTPLGSLGFSGDPDLKSTLLMVDKSFGYDVKIPSDEYRLSPAHHLWVSHLSVYYAWGDPRSDDVLAFVEYSLDPNKSPNDAVIADCLYIIDMILGTPFHIEDLTRRDKRLDHLTLFYDSGADVRQAAR
jgi:hypothetical protein